MKRTFSQTLVLLLATTILFSVFALCFSGVKAGAITTTTAFADSVDLYCVDGGAWQGTGGRTAASGYSSKLNKTVKPLKTFGLFGWIITPSGIDYYEFSLDNAGFSRVLKQNIVARPDVNSTSVAGLPSTYYAGNTTGGFELHFDTTGWGAGTHNVRIRAITKDGNVIEYITVPVSITATFSITAPNQNFCNSTMTLSKNLVVTKPDGDIDLTATFTNVPTNESWVAIYQKSLYDTRISEFVADPVTRGASSWGGHMGWYYVSGKTSVSSTDPVPSDGTVLNLDRNKSRNPAFLTDNQDNKRLPEGQYVVVLFHNDGVKSGYTFDGGKKVGGWFPLAASTITVVDPYVHDEGSNPLPSLSDNKGMFWICGSSGKYSAVVNTDYKISGFGAIGWTGPDCVMRVKIFNFNTDIATSIAGTAVISKDFDFAQDVYVYCNFSKTLNPGKYVVQISCPSANGTVTGAASTNYMVMPLYTNNGTQFTVSGNVGGNVPGTGDYSNASVAFRLIETNYETTVSFDANGGTGGQSSAVTVKYAGVLPSISTTAPTRAGYTFGGWYDAKTGGTQYYDASGNRTVSAWDKKDAAVTLYARWTAIAAIKPTVTATGATVTYGYASASVKVSATPASGHTITGYQWYSSATSGATSGGTAISGATSATYSIDTGKGAGSYYYYCTVSTKRTDNGKTASVSKAATLTVNKATSTALIDIASITGNSFTYNASTKSITIVYSCDGSTSHAFALKAPGTDLSDDTDDVSYEYLDTSAEHNTADKYFYVSGDVIKVKPYTPAGTYTVPIKLYTTYGTDNYSAAHVRDYKSLTVTVSKKAVTLTWGTTSWTYDETAHSTTCTAGSLLSGDSCTVTLDGNSITNAGTATVTATGLSNSNYKLPTSNLSKTLTVNKAPSSWTKAPAGKSGLSFSYDNGFNGIAQELITAGTASGGTAEYKLGADGEYGTAVPKAINANTDGYTVYYKITGDSNHENTAEATLTVKIAKAKCTVTKAPTAKTSLIYNGSLQAVVNAGEKSGNAVMYYQIKPVGEESTSSPWSSNLTNVNSAGKDAGDYWLYYFAYAKDDKENWASSSKSYIEVTISPLTASLSWSSASKVYDGQKLDISCTVGNLCGSDTCSVTLDTSSIGPDVASKSVTAKALGNSNYQLPSSASETFSITKADSTMTVTDPEAIYVNGKYTLANSVSENIGTLTYSIASQTTTGSSISSGVLTAGVCSASSDKNQQVVVTVTDAGDANHNGTSKTITVPVKKYTPSLKWNSNNTVLSYPAPASGAATATSTSGSCGTITYTSSKPDVISVDSSTGLMTPVANTAASATVTATLAATSTVKGGTLSRTVSVGKTDSELSLSASSGTLLYPDSLTFTVTKNTSGGELSVTSSNPLSATATVDNATGVVTVYSHFNPYPATITVTSAANNGFEAASATFEVTVKLVDTENPLQEFTVSATNYRGPYDGKSHQASLSVTPADATVKFGTERGTYTLNEMPSYKTVGTHTVFYKIEKDGYIPACGSVSVVIEKTEGSVTLSKTSCQLSYPATDTFTVTRAGNGIITVRSTNPSAATASVNGNTVTVTSLAAGGRTKIVVNVESDGTYKTCAASCTVEVSAKYIVTLNAGEARTTGNKTVYGCYGEALQQIIIPTRTGYLFRGYFTGPDGAGTKYYNADGTCAKTWDIASAKTLYAYWLPALLGNVNVPSASSSYDGDIAVFNFVNAYGSVLQTMPAASGAFLSLNAVTAIPAKAGFAFAGWEFGAYGDVTPVSVGGTQYYAKSAISRNGIEYTVIFADAKCTAAEYLTVYASGYTVIEIAPLFEAVSKKCTVRISLAGDDSIAEYNVGDTVSVIAPETVFDMPFTAWADRSRIADENEAFVIIGGERCAVISYETSFDFECVRNYDLIAIYGGSDIVENYGETPVFDELIKN